MKKNKMMRLASFMLVATLLSTSVISGTFAKYITTDSAQDEARVAKFGVVVSVKGDLFGETYDGTNHTIMSYDEDGGTVSAVSTARGNIVAPGTTNRTGMTLSITGKPEVATSVQIDKAQDTTGKAYADADIYLAKGTYGVMVEYTGAKTAENVIKYYVKDSSGVYTKATASNVGETVYELQDTVAFTDADYHPLKWYVDSVAVADQAAVGNALNSFISTGNLPNTDLAKSMTVGWEWEFGDDYGDQPNTNDERTNNDAKDTILGNLMAEAGNVVVLDGADTYKTITFATQSVTPNSANVMRVAKNGDTVLACLTVAFSTRLTVTQVN